MNWMVRLDDGIDWFTVEPMYGEAGVAAITITVADYSGRVR